MSSMTEFDKIKWGNLRSNFGQWWQGELGRPIMITELTGYRTSRKAPELPFYPFASFYDNCVTVEQILDVWDYQLSCTRYFGDGFPSIFPNFGPGVMAAFLGSELKNGNGTVWMEHLKADNIGQIELKYDPDNYWLKRIKTLFNASVKRWNGNVLIRTTDLGGNLDVLAALRGSENLIMDLFDEPDKVNRLTWKTHDLWWKYFNEINNTAEGINPGYSSWCGIYSQEPYYMLQCDFAYMLTPKLFNEFSKPELVKTSSKLKNAFYHLDGVGQLQHLDSILEIESIKGIQWIPGAGQPDISNWADIYRKIHKAGKLIQFYASQYEKNSLEILDIISDQIGSAKGLCVMFCGGIEKEEDVLRYIEKYKV